MRTLIVDDDYSSRILLSRYLKDQGQTVIAEDGEKAVAAFQEARDSRMPFDLVCLDIMLPLMNGPTALKHFRRLEGEAGIVDGAGCKVILLSAFPEAATMIDTVSNRCDAYLSKPISKERLFREIQSLGLTVKYEV